MWTRGIDAVCWHSRTSRINRSRAESMLSFLQGILAGGVPYIVGETVSLEWWGTVVMGGDGLTIRDTMFVACDEVRSLVAALCAIVEALKTPLVPPKDASDLVVSTIRAMRDGVSVPESEFAAEDAVREIVAATIGRPTSTFQILPDIENGGLCGLSYGDLSLPNGVLFSLPIFPPSGASWPVWERFITGVICQLKEAEALALDRYRFLDR